MKALKTVHIICASLWLGSSVSMNLLRYLVDDLDNAGMFWMARTLEIIDMKILVPGAVGCLLTGIVYGLFTNWGFFRHRWLTVKWILTVFIISFGTFHTGPLIKENVVIGRSLLEGSGSPEQYWLNAGDSIVSGLLQLSLLMIATVISVYRPWKGNAKHPAQAPRRPQ